MKNKEVLLLGATPNSAGIGGVSIHVDRLVSWLKEKEFPHKLVDYKTVPIRKQLSIIQKYKVVHIHVSRPTFRLIYILYATLCGCKTILTIHGNIGRFSFIGNLFDMLSVKMCTLPIAINHNSYVRICKWNKQSVEISAFLPPSDRGYIPEYIRVDIENAHHQGKVVIAANASAITFTHDGKEIYGIDFVIKFFEKKDHYLLCISDPSGQYYAKYKNSINNVRFICEPHSFFELMRLSDIMLRPTATDGDSLSVREALYLKKKVIATDCVDRPHGVILFHYNNIESLDEALEAEVLDDYNGAIFNPIEDIIDIYNKVLNM